MKFLPVFLALAGKKCLVASFGLHFKPDIAIYRLTERYGKADTFDYWQNFCDTQLD